MPKNLTEEILCFLELKAAGLDEATKQIINAHRKIKQLLDEAHISNILLKACICMRHQSPPGEMRRLKELKRTFGSGNVQLKSGVKHHKDLGTFLRKSVK